MMTRSPRKSTTKLVQQVHNCRYWASENPNLVYEQPIHDLKIANLDEYLTFLDEIYPQLTEEELNYAYLRSYLASVQNKSLLKKKENSTINGDEGKEVSPNRDSCNKEPTAARRFYPSQYSRVPLAEDFDLGYLSTEDVCRSSRRNVREHLHQ
ncbi:hypothetical protein ANN_00997 [Periplaneta americana]|uniref:Uncharacterized protein n=1 Tax=Periplaneta americana TaxID=6978 RepID=A0ABQ8TSF9_PERAM|nr:hypothetical protein ANN_00997 [Periplaneta americana]